MKKTLLSLLSASLLSSSIYAFPMSSFDNDPDFAKMNQYFNSLLESHINTSALSNMNYPRTDIQNTKKQIIVKFDLAGVAKENIKLSINDKKILTVEGDKKEEKEIKKGDFVKKEIFYGSFKKSLKLPDNIEEDKLQTEFKDGILTITIPKKELKEPKAKIIQIK
ncbi:Hsp20/alpha crystallin family protein [Sulfurimonas sp.]